PEQRATGPTQVPQRRRPPPHDEADALDLEAIRRYRTAGVVIGELHPAGPGRRVRLERAGDRLREVAGRCPTGEALEEPDVPLVVGLSVDPVAHAAEEPNPRAHGDARGGRGRERELVARIDRGDVPRLCEPGRHRAAVGDVGRYRG